MTLPTIYKEILTALTKAAPPPEYALPGLISDFEDAEVSSKFGAGQSFFQEIHLFMGQRRWQELCCISFCPELGLSTGHAVLYRGTRLAGTCVLLREFWLGRI